MLNKLFRRSPGIAKELTHLGRTADQLAAVMDVRGLLDGACAAMVPTPTESKRVVMTYSGRHWVWTGTKDFAIHLMRLTDSRLHVDDAVAMAQSMNSVAWNARK